MPQCSRDAIAIRMMDTNRDGVITSHEYAQSAIGVLQREALLLIRNGRPVTSANFLSSDNTSVTDIQTQAESFRHSAPSLFAGIIQQLSPTDAKRIADAAASLRRDVREAGIFERIAAGVELFVANSASSDRFHESRRRCEAQR